jgi:two-component system, LytTR family, sensor histidine kinase AlgZ
MSTTMELPAARAWRALDRSFGETLVAVLAVNFAGAVLALLFVATFNAGVPFARIASTFLDSFVYSNCIGTLITFSVLRATPALRRLRFPLDWAALAAMALVLAYIGTLAAGGTLMLLGSFRDYGWLALHRMGLGFLLGLLLAFGTYLYEGVRLRLQATTRELRARELERERSQKLAAQASLASLESRIHPHFLFNTLNSISALIQEDPALADEMVGRLAALLRFSLDASDRGSIPLEQELRVAADYLEIEKSRFGERLRYSVDVPQALHNTPVPPFVVQTLVENSVKHAVARQREGSSIRIRARAEGSTSEPRCLGTSGGQDAEAAEVPRYRGSEVLIIEVADDGPGFTLDTIPLGHGLDNLRARLAASFGDGARLDVDHNAVRVTVPRT